MSMFKYVVERILLMFFTFFAIMVICFFMIKSLPVVINGTGAAAQIEKERYEALGYFEPVYVQFFIYLKNVFTDWNWGVSWKIDYLANVTDVVSDRLLPTILINVYSLILSVPIGIGLGIYAALRKNRWQDQVVSTAVMLFISVPSFVYAFVLQYFLSFKIPNGLPAIMSSLSDAGDSYFSWTMFKSMILPILALSFGTIAGLTRFTRAELTEALTSEYMLLARTKGLKKSQAISRHALKNAMVPILPSIISSFVGILSGSFIIEQIFSVPGVGNLYIKSITLKDYDVFVYVTAFYTFIGLAANILVDLSYGFLDPRVRMGARK